MKKDVEPTEIIEKISSISFDGDVFLVRIPKEKSEMKFQILK